MSQYYDYNFIDSTDGGALPVDASTHTTPLPSRSGGRASFSLIRRGVTFHLGAVLLFLIALNLVATCFGQQDNLFSFSTLLNLIETCPTFDFTVAFIQDITADWGAFNFIKNIINVSINAINFWIFIGQGFVNLLSFVFHFLGFFFGR